MAEYRWDLHYTREANEGRPRCRATTGDRRCEFVEHRGHVHASLDGSVQWLDLHGDEDEDDE